VCTYIYNYVYIYVYMCTYMYTYMYMYMYRCMHVCIYTHACIYAYIYTHVHRCRAEHRQQPLFNCYRLWRSSRALWREYRALLCKYTALLCGLNSGNTGRSWHGQWPLSQTLSCRDVELFCKVHKYIYTGQLCVNVWLLVANVWLFGAVRMRIS